MTLYDRILLPTDGSAGMDRVVDHAAALAAVHDAGIHALYVVDPGSIDDLPMQMSFETIGSMLHEEGERALGAVTRRVDDVPVETTTVEGTPDREIVKHANEVDCDVVVMGTHGRSGIDRWLLGSVAERVVRRSTVPVLTVHVGDVVAEGDDVA
jgi:nucleotide-binding universal stress UspA family protein